MIAKIEKSRLSGYAGAPPSKSMAHRLLLLAALTGGRCKVNNLAYSDDVLAMLDCLRALGAECEVDGSTVSVDGSNFMKKVTPSLNCRESGNTLRFLIPLCLTLGKKVTLSGSDRLMERPQSVYEDLCSEHGFNYDGRGPITVKGGLRAGKYTLDGSVSSQFISGMIFALLYCEGDSVIKILPPFESRSYVELTLSAVHEFGGEVSFTDPLTIAVKGRSLTPRDVTVEGDFSNSAFLEAFNFIGGDVFLSGLSLDSAQGDKAYRFYFPKFLDSSPVIDIRDCPDLGPIYIALGVLKNGCTLIGTRRLSIKESDRGEAMKEELKKFGADIVIEFDKITVPKCSLKTPSEPLSGHNDHRIVMSLAVICSVVGGTIEGAEAVRKTYPDFFDVTKNLGLRVELTE